MIIGIITGVNKIKHNHDGYRVRGLESTNSLVLLE